MTGEAVLFWVLATLAVVAAIAMVAAPKAVYSAMFLACTMIVLAVLYIAQGVLDLLRGRILGRVGTSLDEALNARVFDTIVRLPLIAGNRSEGLQPLRDLDNVRSFLGSMGPGAFFDLPWLPFYMLICFAFHWLLGVTALVGAIILVTLTLITEYPDETLSGAALIAAHDAQTAAVIAAYEAFQALEVLDWNVG